MRSQIDTYKNDGAKAMKHMWFVILLFSIIQVAVSIAVASKNSRSIGGYKSATFAAIWAMFLVLIFLVLGAQIVFRGRATKLQVGFLVGSAAMLCELFFVLMVLFFILGNEASVNGFDTKQADLAYAVFALFNTIMYLVWAIILSVHRDAVSVVEDNPNNATNAQGYSQTNNNVGGGGPSYGMYGNSYASAGNARVDGGVDDNRDI